MAFQHYWFHIVQIATDPYLQTDFSSALYEIPEQVEIFERIAPPENTDHWKINANCWFDKHFSTIEPVVAVTDIIHIANTGFAGWLGLGLAEKLGKPLILTEHALYWKEIQMGAAALECGYKVPGDSEAKVKMAGQFKQIAEAVYDGADEVVSVSKCNMPEQKAMGAADVH